MPMWSGPLLQAEEVSPPRSLQLSLDVRPRCTRIATAVAVAVDKHNERVSKPGACKIR
jgi:hypothetical protein